MNDTLHLPSPLGQEEMPLRSDREIVVAIWSLLGTQNHQPVVERRRDQRFPFPYPVRLTPLTADGSLCSSDSVVVLGKHITEHGMDFYFNQPIPYRRMVASFEQNGREVVHILMDLTWCRFGRHGWYENGGRFLQMLPTPLPARVPLAS